MAKMRIFSWNVNGVRAAERKGALREFLEKFSPDVVCLQEIKARPEQMPDVKGYKSYINSAERPGYSGTATLVSEAGSAKSVGVFEKNAVAVSEGRVLCVEFDEFYLVNVYTPNSKPDLARLELREKEWDPGFLGYLKELGRVKPVVVCGDFNAAHEEIDLARPEANHHNAGFTDEERQGIRNLLAAGFVDTFRSLHPGEHRYTWWSHWGQARERNVGWRIDYFFVSGALAGAVTEAEIHEEVLGSDHCPVSITLEIPEGGISGKDTDGSAVGFSENRGGK